MPDSGGGGGASAMPILRAPISHPLALNAAALTGRITARAKNDLRFICVPPV